MLTVLPRGAAEKECVRMSHKILISRPLINRNKHIGRLLKKFENCVERLVILLLKNNLEKRCRKW